MDNWKAEYIAKLRCEQDPRLLLAASDRCASKALECAENPDQNAALQNAALIYARVATAKAIAAVAAATLEKPGES